MPERVAPPDGDSSGISEEIRSNYFFGSHRTAMAFALKERTPAIRWCRSRSRAGRNRKRSNCRIAKDRAAFRSFSAAFRRALKCSSPSLGVNRPGNEFLGPGPSARGNARQGLFSTIFPHPARRGYRDGVPHAAPR
jgi:hypothetical protein